MQLRQADPEFDERFRYRHGSADQNQTTAEKHDLLVKFWI
jgi:hypothetical protein